MIPTGSGFGGCDGEGGNSRFPAHRGAIDDYGYSRISATGSSGVINTKAEAGKTYDYKVVAVNKTGAANSADSGVVSVKSK